MICQMTRTTLLVIVLVALCAVPGAAQTFFDSVIDQEVYSFRTAETGQYEATLTWGRYDENDVLSLALLCNDGAGEPVRHAVSLGSRDRIARLNVGIKGARECFLSVFLVDGIIAQYSLNLAATSPVVVMKVSSDQVPELTLSAFDVLAAQLRSLRPPPRGFSGPALFKAAPTRTFLEQIRGGVPNVYTFDVSDSTFLHLTAMWNRVDSDLRVWLTCSDGSTSMDLGSCESGQERFLRFDADLPPGTSCAATAESPNTMVYALNVALYGDGGLSPAAPPPPPCIPRSQCCKICVSGKACGDSCISRGYTCHRPPGCACNSSDVCP